MQSQELLMTTDLITTPSGMVGRIRGLKVREERILADRKLAKSGAQVDELLRACWVETEDPGPYRFSPEQPVPWDRVLVGDRFFALLKIRALTYGPNYAFALSCEQPGCRARIDWELSLDDLPVRPLTPALLAGFQADNRFPVELPDAQRRVWIKLMTGADERRLAQQRSRASDKVLSDPLAARVVAVEGVEERARRAFLEDLTMRDANALLEAFDAHDCGVETGIEVECPTCGAQQQVELPFDRTFLMPAAKPKPRASDPDPTSYGPTSP
jgi:hypothetical protein